MKTNRVRRALDFLAKMGLSVRDDPPKVLDPATRQWTEAVDGFALSVSAVANEDPEAVPAISIALRNVGAAAVTLKIPAWLFFYRIEIAGAAQTPYGRALVSPVRDLERQTVTLAPGGVIETQIPVGALFSIRRGTLQVVTVSCKPRGTPLSASISII